MLEVKPITAEECRRISLERLEEIEEEKHKKELEERKLQEQQDQLLLDRIYKEIAVEARHGKRVHYLSYGIPDNVKNKLRESGFIVILEECGEDYDDLETEIIW